MTSRERIIKAIRKEKVDRIPVSPWGLGKLAPDSDIAKELISKTDIFMETFSGVDPFWGEYINQLEQVGEGLYQISTPSASSNGG